MTRTRTPGYLRDIRRLTVALSRARLGLYILGRRNVFETLPTTSRAFQLLLERPEKLMLTIDENFPTSRLLTEDAEGTEMEGVEHLGQYVFEMTQAKVEMLKRGNNVLLPQESGAEIVKYEEDDEKMYGDGGGEMIVEGEPDGPQLDGIT